MLKKIGLPMLALAAITAFAAPQAAQAQVRFGVSVGAPVYGYPAYSAPVYTAPAPYPYGYVAPYAYPYYGYAPAYVGPPVGFGFGWGSGYGGYYRGGYGYRAPVVHEFRGGGFHGGGFHGRR